MTTSTSRTRRLRWAFPLAIGGAVAGVALLPRAATADEHPSLPARTAAQLLVDLQGSDVHALSGTVVETARLGLPDLPTGSTGGAASPLGLLAGSHSVRVWADGPQRQRVALLGQLSEYDAVHSGTDLWTYTSAGDKVTHTTLPSDGAQRPAAAGDPAAYATPQAAADALLKAVDPTTLVEVDRTARVAGRPAYQLVLKPRDTSSLVGSVRIAMDAVTHAPLRVQAFSASDAATPAIQVGFTDVSFSTPAASVFRFTAPPGSTVTESKLPTAADAKGWHARPAGGTQPTVLGKGWTSVAELSAPAATGGAKGSSTQLLDQLTTRVPGGRVLTTKLVSALLTDDGRVLVGAVTPQVLQDLAK